MGSFYIKNTGNGGCPGNVNRCEINGERVKKFLILFRENIFRRKRQPKRERAWEKDRSKNFLNFLQIKNT